MFEARINGHTYQIAPADSGFLVNGEAVIPDVADLKNGRFHVLLNGRGYRIQVITIDRTAGLVEVQINNKAFAVEVKSRLDLLLEKLGMHAGSRTAMNHVKAPMPGLVVDIKVKPGDTVKPGDPLLILEAMKMENIIRAQGEAVVKTVKVSMGKTVDKNEVLIEF